LAARRNKSQARRNDRNGLPGWAWLVLGLLLGIGLILAAPRLLQSEGGDGFFRPRPNPDAQPPEADAAEDEPIVPDSAPIQATAPKAKEPSYDFYTMLPGDEVALSDAELAASAEAEARRAAQAADDAGDAPPAGDAGDAARQEAGEAERPAAAQAEEARYLLQAGAFAASGDAEAVKARIALLGLGARVESAQIDGKTVYRVRMGPYGTASELAEAKRKLASGGLPAMAIRAK
jgi:cell division protein FtsN